MKKTAVTEPLFQMWDFSRGTTEGHWKTVGLIVQKSTDEE